jgi:predicted nucleic acid-binding protein
MSVVLDTSAVVAAYDRADPGHEAVAELLRALDDELVTTPLVAAQMDRALTGTAGRDALWKDLDSGAITVRWWADAMDETLRIARRNPILGLADASLVALAGRLRTDRIATFDPHFRSVTLPRGRAIVMLPDNEREVRIGRRSRPSEAPSNDSEGT